MGPGAVGPGNVPSVSTEAPPDRRAEAPLLEAIVSRIEEAFPSEVSELAVPLARAYFRRVPAEQLSGLELDHLVAQVRAVLDFIDRRGTSPIGLRIFNPDRTEHGYETEGSVLEINTEDRPFLIDSVLAELEGRGLHAHRMFHPVIGTIRDERGGLVRVVNAREAPTRESVQHLELDRRLEDAELADLERSVARVLRDVARAVRDFEPMQAAVKRMIEAAEQAGARYDREEIVEVVSFLQWLLDLNFVFLGFREYRLVATPAGRAVETLPESGLGILADASGSAYAKPALLSELSPDVARRFEEGDLLVITKTNSLATVHRRAKMDYIGVRQIGPGGEVLGELRMLGLFTSKAYTEPASQTPLLRRKVKQILAAEDLFEGSHDHKRVIQLFESFPKDELFAASLGEIHRNIVGLLELQERQQVRLFLRRDLLERSVSLLVAMPRDRFNAELRKDLQDLFMERFSGTSVEYYLALGEEGPAQIHFTVWVGGGAVPDVSFSELEQEVIRRTRSWSDLLSEELVDRYGRERGRDLAERWGARFPDYYRTSVPLSLAAGDTARLDELERGKVPFVVGLQNESGAGERLTRVALYRRKGKLPLSELLPALEALGLQVVEEVPTRLSGGDGQTFIHDFGVVDSGSNQLDLEQVGDRVAQALAAVWAGEAESDSLDRLIVSAGLTHHQVAILRAYHTYWRRVSPAFTVEYVHNAFVAHPELTAAVMALFEARFDPDSGADEQALLDQILAALDDVPSPEEDRILRSFVGMIQATVRTNAFRSDRTCLSFKLRSADVPDVPKPLPLFEIFVYAQEVEAVHLRGGRVARGGIRWSDRREDYRTEVLGLMKAQMTKNSVIVPTGSKGGFVLRRPPSDPATLREEVRRQYITFMEGLLDLTDNLVGGEIRHPPSVRIHDGDDPYLVVAADKGTAHLSDTANEVAARYGYWLSDAFASGGSTGYDHKELGITARGAWESAKRHFRELGIDRTRPFTVAGIGDMSGDVFGNGMLLSDQIKLVAAFDHRHIFIDPDPDPALAHAERRRLFETPRSTWSDYDPTSISAGGGIYSRGSKRIELSSEAQEALGVQQSSFVPTELIKAILAAPVDLLWNGGIGTYVKASTEVNEQVGDRANDPVRIDGSEVRARVVVEGGNLGFTPRGRIEYAMGGGRINTDFIDNSGGVDCSDREVNLKILLGLAEEAGEIGRSERDQLVAAAADGVTRRVLYDNYLQVQIISQEVETSARRLDTFEDLMQTMEAAGILDRSIERLPSSEELAERGRLGQGLARPELALLVAYAKRSVYEALLESDLPDSPYLEADLREYFPDEVVARFGHLIGRHPLRRELVATLVANDLVNSEGIAYVHRLMSEMGADAAEVARAYRIARDVTGAVERWEAVERLFEEVDLRIWKELMGDVDWLVDVTSRWYLAKSSTLPLEEEIPPAREAFAELAAAVPDIGPPSWREEREAVAERLLRSGVPEEVARRHAFQAELVHGPDIIELAGLSGWPVVEVARAFFLVGQAARLDKLEELSDRLPPGSRWHRWAVRTLEDDILLLRRQLSEQVVREAGERGAEEAVHGYLGNRHHRLAHVVRFMASLEREGKPDLATLTVAIRQIRSLIG